MVEGDDVLDLRALCSNNREVSMDTYELAAGTVCILQETMYNQKHISLRE